MSGHRFYQLYVQNWARFMGTVRIDNKLTVEGVEIPGTIPEDLAALSERLTVLEAASGVGDGTAELAGRLTTLEQNNTLTAARVEEVDGTKVPAVTARVDALESDVPTRTGKLTARVGVLEDHTAERFDAVTTRLDTDEASAAELGTRVSVLETASSSADAVLSGRLDQIEGTLPAAVNSLTSRVNGHHARISALEAKPTPATPESVTAVANRVTALEARPTFTKAVLPAKGAGQASVAGLVARIDAITDALVAAGLARYP